MYKNFITMNWTRVFSIFFLLVAIGLGYFLYDRIYSRIEQEREVRRIEANIIEKLKMIREAEIAYQAIHGQYTSDWDKLLSFIDTGKIYLIQKTEEIITLPYGADSISVQIDTLGSVPVRDSLFSEQKYPNFNLDRLPYIPGKPNTRFDIYADKITKSGIEVDVIEVKDVDPLNPMRSEESKAFNRKPLRFGSRTEVTTTGNWE